MNDLVIYASKRGSTEEYAREFAKGRNTSAINYNQITKEEFLSVKNIYYFGSVYAGKVTGLDHLIKLLPTDLGIAIIAVGLTSITDKKKILELRDKIHEKVPQARIFHLRGRLSRNSLSLPEKLLLKLLSNTKDENSNTELVDSV